MKKFKIKNGTAVVEAIPQNMGSMEGYGVRYAPGANIVWCEKSYFERVYEKV